MINEAKTNITNFEKFVKLADYSLMDTLRADPDGTRNGNDHRPRQVFSGHFVPVTPTPLEAPEYVAHSSSFFAELGLSDELALDESFKQVFSGDLSAVLDPMRSFGWATGYALSIYGTEYTLRFERAMVMGMAVQYPFLKVLLTANVGKCS